MLKVVKEKVPGSPAITSALIACARKMIIQVNIKSKEEARIISEKLD